MRILICTGIYPPDVGGPATYSKILNEELPPRGIDVDVLSFGSVRGLPKIIRHIFYMLKIYKYIRNVDIIFAQDPVSVGLPACFMATLFRKKFLLKIVGDYAWEQYSLKINLGSGNYVSPDDFQEMRAGFIASARKHIERYVASRAERVIVPSEYLKKIIIKWGVPNEKIYVIYNSVEVPRFGGGKSETRAVVGVEGGVILSAGRLVPWKGFSVLVDIMPDILEDFPDAKLYIAGDGPERAGLARRAKSVGVAENVVLLGSLPRETLLNYIKASDVFALNTGYEGFSHLLLEVMSAGTPIVTTDIGGNPEIVENGVDGILVSHNNRSELIAAIKGVLGGMTDTDSLVSAAEKKVSEFTKERMVSGVATLMRNM